MAQVSQNDDEVIVVFNGLDHDSLKTSMLFPQVKFQSIAATTPAKARNIALQNSQSDWICFLDDDVELPSDYINKAKSLIKNHPEVDVLGGPDKESPRASSFEQALSLAIQSPLSMAKTRLRHNEGPKWTEASEAELILCHMWVKRELCLSFPFDDRFFRNEENIFLHQLKREKKGIYYSGDLFCYHRRKSHLWGMSQAVMGSGYYRAKTFKNIPGSFNLLYFVPTIFLFYLLSLVCLGQFLFYWFPLGLYLLFNLAFGIKYTTNKKDLLGEVCGLQFSINIFYGIGFLRGLLFA